MNIMYIIIFVIYLHIFLNKIWTTCPGNTFIGIISIREHYTCISFTVLMWRQTQQKGNTCLQPHSRNAFNLSLLCFVLLSRTVQIFFIFNFYFLYFISFLCQRYYFYLYLMIAVKFGSCYVLFVDELHI